MLAVRGVGSAASTDGWVARPSTSDEPPNMSEEAVADEQEQPLDESEEVVITAEQKQAPAKVAPTPTTAAPQRTATRVTDDPPKTPPPAGSSKRPAATAAASSAVDAKTEPTEMAAEPAAPGEASPVATVAQTPLRAAGPRCTCSRASWIYGGETGLSCDGPGCGRGFKSGETRYSCETCDFDLCAGCAEKMGVGVNSASKKRRR